MIWTGTDTEAHDMFSDLNALDFIFFQAEIQEEYRQQYPHLTEEQVIQATRSYIMSLLHQNHFVAPAGPRLPELAPSLLAMQSSWLCRG